MRPAYSGALQPEPEPFFHVLEVAMREYCFLKDTSINELKGLRELKTGSSLHQNLNFVLADLLYITRSARGQSSYAHDVFCKEEIENAVRFMSIVMVPRVHDHFFSSDLTFFQWDKSLRCQMEMVEYVKADPEGLKEKLLLVLK